MPIKLKILSSKFNAICNARYLWTFLYESFGVCIMAPIFFTPPLAIRCSTAGSRSASAHWSSCSSRWAGRRGRTRSWTTSWWRCRSPSQRGGGGEPCRSAGGGCMSVASKYREWLSVHSTFFGYFFKESLSQLTFSKGSLAL